MEKLLISKSFTRNGSQGLPESCSNTLKATFEEGLSLRYSYSLFPAFRTYLDRTELTVKEVLQNINHYATIYEDISNPDRDSREGIFFHRLDVLDTTTPYPVLLWNLGQEDIPEAQQRKAIEAIESWLMRRMLCRLTTKSYNQVFIELLDVLRQVDGERVGDTVVEFFWGCKVRVTTGRVRGTHGLDG